MPKRLRNHKKLWRETDLALLEQSLEDGLALEAIANRLGRSPRAVKLEIGRVNVWRKYRNEPTWEFTNER